MIISIKVSISKSFVIEVVLVMSIDVSMMVKAVARHGKYILHIHAFMLACRGHPVFLILIEAIHMAFYGDFLTV